MENWLFHHSLALILFFLILPNLKGIIWSFELQSAVLFVCKPVGIADLVDRGCSVEDGPHDDFCVWREHFDIAEVCEEFLLSNFDVFNVIWVDVWIEDPSQSALDELWDDVQLAIYIEGIQFSRLDLSVDPGSLLLNNLLGIWGAFEIVNSCQNRPSSSCAGRKITEFEDESDGQQEMTCWNLADVGGHRTKGIGKVFGDLGVRVATDLSENAGSCFLALQCGEDRSDVGLFTDQSEKEMLLDFDIMPTHCEVFSCIEVLLGRNWKKVMIGSGDSSQFVEGADLFFLVLGRFGLVLNQANSEEKDDNEGKFHSM